MSGSKITALSVLLIFLGVGIAHAAPLLRASPDQTTTEAGPACHVSDAEYSPDGQFFITTNGRAIIWDSTRVERIRVLSAWNNMIDTAEYSPDGQYIVTATNNRVIGGTKNVILWNAQTGRLLRAFENHTAPIVAPDGKSLLTVSRGSLHVWDIVTGQLLRVINNQNGIVSGIEGVAYRPDGLFFATYNSYGFQIWDAASVTRLSHRDVYQVGAARYSPDGQVLLTISLSQLSAWNPQTSERIHSFTGDAHWDARYSPSGRFIVAAYRSLDRVDGKVTIFDAKSYASVYELFGHTDRVTSAVFSPDEQFILTSSWDGRVIIWDAANATPFHILDGCGGM
jgi:WD40 repeat protein